jgi:hypothetical protein
MTIEDCGPYRYWRLSTPGNVFSVAAVECYALDVLPEKSAKRR